MITVYTFRVRPDGDCDGTAERLDERISRMLKYHPTILEASAQVQGASVTLAVRAAGQDRTRMIGAVRKFATGLLVAEHLAFQRPLVPEVVTTEPNGRQMLMGEGRTPRGPYRPRKSSAQRAQIPDSSNA